MPPSGVDYASEFLNGYAPEYVVNYNKDLFFILLKFAANPFARTNLIVTRA